MNEKSEHVIDDSDGIHMIFKDKNSFEEWNEDVSFHLGLPKISFNVKTGKANYSHVIKKYAECFSSHITDDKRVCSKANQNLDHNFLNEEAQKRYHFKLANFIEMEEAGFYRDFQLDIDYQYEFRLLDFIYSDPTEFNVCLDHQHLYSSLSHSFDLTLNFISKERSSYYFDSGESLEKNRISFYSNKEGKLCFRFIDTNSKVFLFVMDLESSRKLFNKRLCLEFRFAIPSKNFIFSLFINNEHIYSKEIQENWEFQWSPQNNKIGSNISGNYNGALTLKKHSIDILKFSSDHQTNKQLLEIINEQYIDHQKDENIYVTKDEQLVSMGWIRKEKRIIILP